jgi:hypothetical protein
MELAFIKRIENMPQHKATYKVKVLSKAKNKLKMMLAGLGKELCAGQAPTDFKVRIDAIYQEIMGKHNHIYDLPRLLTDYNEAYGERYVGLYNPYDEAKWIEETGIITRIKDMTAHFMNNLTIDILKDFECNVVKRLKNADIDLDDAHRLVCKIRDEAIEKFKKIERGLYNIHYVIFGSI